MALKNCALFTNCITKIDGTTKDDDKDLNFVMPMYNLLECSSNYSDTTGKDEVNNFDANIVYGNALKSLKYKAKLLRSTEADGANGPLRNRTIAVVLKDQFLEIT